MNKILLFLLFLANFLFANTTTAYETYKNGDYKTAFIQLKKMCDKKI